MSDSPKTEHKKSWNDYIKEKAQKAKEKGSILAEKAKEKSSHLADRAREKRAEYVQKRQGSNSPEHSKPSLFGTPLDTVMDHYATTSPDALYCLPLIVTDSIHFIESNYIHEKGIYRLSGQLSLVQQLKNEWEKTGGRAVLEEYDVHVVAGVLKSFLRELPTPLIPEDMQPSFQSLFSSLPDGPLHVSSLPPSFIDDLTDLTHRLPSTHYYLLSYLSRHLSKVKGESVVNMMSGPNLGVVFSVAYGTSARGVECLLECWQDCLWVGEESTLNPVQVQPPVQYTFPDIPKKSPNQTVIQPNPINDIPMKPIPVIVPIEQSRHSESPILQASVAPPPKPKRSAQSTSSLNGTSIEHQPSTHSLHSRSSTGHLLDSSLHQQPHTTSSSRSISYPPLGSNEAIVPKKPPRSTTQFVPRNTSPTPPVDTQSSSSNPPAFQHVLNEFQHVALRKTLPK